MSTVTVTVPPTTAVAAVASERPTGFSSIATGAEYKGVPQFDDPLKKREWQLEHMAAALRNFARNGYTDGTAGHISVRDPIDPNTFWINPYVSCLRSFPSGFRILESSNQLTYLQNGPPLWDVES
jgi:hypothetical protein